MSKVQPRGEISPLTAALVAAFMLMVSGLSVWRFVLKDAASSLYTPAAHTTPMSSHTKSAPSH